MVRVWSVVQSVRQPEEEVLFINSAESAIVLNVIEASANIFLKLLTYSVQI